MLVLQVQKTIPLQVRSNSIAQAYVKHITPLERLKYTESLAWLLTRTRKSIDSSDRAA